jgi:hypothetical protein
MRTLTLKISDDYFDRFVAFVDMLPKKAVKIAEDKKSKEVELLQSEIKEAFEDVKSGRVKSVRTIK